MLTDVQKKSVQAIVNVFETGRPLGDYGKVTLLKGDPGHLTYGRSQTTLASGNLYLLLKSYCERPDADLGRMLDEYLPRLAARDLTLDYDMSLRALLREAGEDPSMHAAQDEFFDRIYWTPSLTDAARSGIVTALGTAVVYDSRIHGSWSRLRDITTERHGRPSAEREKDWIGSYVQERRNWLATHPNAALHATIYRMDAFRRLIDDRKWELALPITVRGARIDEEALMLPAPVRVSAEDPAERQLRLETPFLVGDDVEELQRALVRAGTAVSVDGIFGYTTEAAVRRFQQLRGLVADGIVGAATRSALGI